MKLTHPHVVQNPSKVIRKQRLTASHASSMSDWASVYVHWSMWKH